MNHLLTHYDDIKGSPELITYLETAPVADADWQVLKGIYKKLEHEPNEAALVAVIYNIDQASFEQKKNRFPSRATLGYIKRRMARFLRQLAVKDEAMYVSICKGLLKKQKKTIDIKHQWVLVDMLWGNSKRFEQTRHGRGKFIKTIEHNIYRTEEKYPEIWNKHLSVLKDILLTGGLAIEVYEFAVKVLLRNKQRISDFIFTQVARFYESSSPWLWSVANEQCFEAIARGSLHDVKLMAYTYFYAPPHRREQLWRAFQEINNTPERKPSFLRQLVNYFLDDVTIKQKNRWMNQFMEELNSITFKHIALENFSRRVLNSVVILSKDINNISPKLVQENTLILLDTKEPVFVDLVFDIVEQSQLFELKNWLQVFAKSEDIHQEHVYNIFIKKFADKINSSSQSTLNSLVYSEDFFVANFGWKVAVKASSKHTRLVQTLVQQNWWNAHNSAAFQHLLTSKYGSKLVLQHCQHQLQNWIYYKEKIIQISQLAQGGLKTWLEEIMVIDARKNPGDWLYHINKLEDKTDFWNKIKSAKSLLKIKDQFIINYLQSTDVFLHNVAWYILSLKKHKNSTYHKILNALVVHSTSQQGERFLQQMLQLEDEALKDDFLDELKNMIAQNPRLVSKFTAIFDQIIPDLDTKSLLMLIGIVDDSQWANMKAIVGEYLGEKDSTDFWLQALKLIPESSENHLYQRLIEDSNFLENFYIVNSIDVLEVKHPIFSDLLHEWIMRHQDLFAANSTALQLACIHAVAKVRDWAIERAQSLGINAVFALQLMESGMPDAVQYGKTFFQQLSPKNEEVFETIMMLCDSPKVEVRAYGMQLFQSKKEQIHSPMALAYLSEHADSQIQAFVAEQVMKTKIAEKAFVKPFEESVLRTRNRSRKAKEIIKTRLEKQDFSRPKDVGTSPETLLQLARSTNKLDAEWAIQQLTKMALAGKQIEGFAFAEG